MSRWHGPAGDGAAGGGVASSNLWVECTVKTSAAEAFHLDSCGLSGLSGCVAEGCTKAVYVKSSANVTASGCSAKTGSGEGL